MLYYLELLVVSQRLLCRCSHISHASSGMLWQWLPVLLPNCAGCKDVGWPRRFVQSQVIDPVVECGNLVQLLHVLRLDDEAIPRAKIFPNCLRNIAYNHGFGRSDVVLAIDDVDIAFNHFLKVLLLVVQLRHDIERLLLRPITHVHEVRLQILHARFFKLLDFLRI